MSAPRLPLSEAGPRLSRWHVGVFEEVDVEDDIPLRTRDDDEEQEERVPDRYDGTGVY
jgi:hypothetical protein